MAATTIERHFGPTEADIIIKSLALKHPASELSDTLDLDKLEVQFFAQSGHFWNNQKVSRSTIYGEMCHESPKLRLLQRSHNPKIDLALNTGSEITFPKHDVLIESLQTALRSINDEDGDQHVSVLNEALNSNITSVMTREPHLGSRKVDVDFSTPSLPTFFESPGQELRSRHDPR